MELNNEILELVEEAKKYVDANLSAEQVVVLKTVKGNTYSFVNNFTENNFVDEDVFVQKLVEAADTEITYIVCMWNNYGVEIPSMNLRKRLLDICDKNAKTLYVVQGAESLKTKELQWSMP